MLSLSAAKMTPQSESTFWRLVPFGIGFNADLGPPRRAATFWTQSGIDCM